LVFLLVMCIIMNVCSVGYAVFIKGDEYRSEAEQQQMSDTTVTAPRGTIYDCNMNVLAQSASAWLCCATPKNIHKDETRKKIAKFMSELFGTKYKTILKKLSNEDSQYEIIQKKVTAIEKSKAEEFIEENSLDGVLYFTPDSTRYYAKDNFASTVLGFTNIDSVGAAGVELQYDSVLTGTPGRIITAKDAIDGDVPVIAGGQKPAYYHNIANRTGETITIAGSGAYAGYVLYWDIPIFVSDAFSIEFNEGLGIPKYLYISLKNQQERIHDTQKGSGVPHVHPSSIDNLSIPVPPLAVQQQIVDQLDAFESLINNLKTERNLRQKQYEYYREKLLTFK